MLFPRPVSCQMNSVGGVRANRSFDTDVLSAGFARLLSAGQLRR
jgi:hypothetical protein